MPFYIRTEKRLPTRVTEVVMHFKPTSHFLFAQPSHRQSCNHLVIRIQPDEGILLTFGMKTTDTLINNAGKVVFLVTGASKAEKVAQVIEKKPVGKNCRLRWFNPDMES